MKNLALALSFALFSFALLLSSCRGEPPFDPNLKTTAGTSTTSSSSTSSSTTGDPLFSAELIVHVVHNNKQHGGADVFLYKTQADLTNKNAMDSAVTDVGGNVSFKNLAISQTGMYVYVEASISGTDYSAVEPATTGPKQSTTTVLVDLK